MCRGAYLSLALRSLVAAAALAIFAFGVAAPAVAQQNTGQYRAELNQLQLDMHALRGELERFEPKPYYCLPPDPPSKAEDEAALASLEARANALVQRYVALRSSLTAFIGGNHRLAAELELNGSTPLDRGWWRRYDSARDRMNAERARKRDALARAPVRNCRQRTQAPTPQVAPDAQQPAQVQPPTYAPILFPTVPRQFCSEAEQRQFLIDRLNALHDRALENVQRAARFRTEVEQAINAHVQASRAVPADLKALRARAAREYAEQRRLADEAARLREQVLRTPIVDCSKRTGAFDPSPQEERLRERMRDRISHASGTFDDGRKRCDPGAMNAGIAELERLLREARQREDGLHVQDERYLSEDEQAELSEAETDVRFAQRELDRARNRQRECACEPPTIAAPGTVPAPQQPVRQSGQAIATWIEQTDALFEQLNAAAKTRDCERIRALLEQIARRFPKGPQILWASVTPPVYLAKWRWIALRARDACQPAAEESDSIMDEIDHVPVISQAPARPSDPTMAALLDYQNGLRAQAGSVPLKWNPVLASHALEYAQAVAATGQLQHSSRVGRESERENLAMAPHRSNTPMGLVQRWGAEARLFRPGTFPNTCAGDWSQCAHYTQIIWSTTTDVGCGFATGRQFDVLVCRYSPPGNRDGRPVTGVPPVAVAKRPCPPTGVPVGGLHGSKTKQVALTGLGARPN